MEPPHSTATANLEMEIEMECSSRTVSDREHYNGQDDGNDEESDRPSNPPYVKIISAVRRSMSYRPPAHRAVNKRSSTSDRAPNTGTVLGEAPRDVTRRGALLSGNS